MVSNSISSTEKEFSLEEILLNVPLKDLLSSIIKIFKNKYANPLPIWKNYKKSVLMLFSEFDDSTPAREVKLKVDNLKNINIKTILVTNGQHIGLETNSICKNDFSDLTKFHKDFFAEMKIWLKTL